MYTGGIVPAIAPCGAPEKKPAAGHLLEKIVVAGFDSYDALAGA